MLRASNLHSYRVNVKIEGISSHHTLSKMYCYIKVNVSGFMFGPLPHTTLIRQLLKLIDNIRNIFHTDISNGMTSIFFFFDLPMVFITREVINPFPDLTK